MTRIAIKPITIQDAITQSLSFVLSFISTPSIQYLDVLEGLASFPPFYVNLGVTDRVFALAVRLDPGVEADGLVVILDGSLGLTEVGVFQPAGSSPLNTAGNLAHTTTAH